MDPFEDLIRELGKTMDIDLKPDSHQSCRLVFSQEKIAVQIDLDTYADKILIGVQLGTLAPGSYRERIFRQALRVNGTSRVQRGTLAYSEKNHTLVLFAYLPIAVLNGEKLYKFLQLFVEHARIWTEAIKEGQVPSIEEDIVPKSSGMLGLTP